MLYQGVFGLQSELEEAVIFLELQKFFPKDHCRLSCSPNNVLSVLETEKADIVQKVCRLSCPPVPYRVAKALHPALYRNVELDIVQEEKREARVRTLESCKGFSPGDKCQVVLEENSGPPYIGHIQAIDEQRATVLVFIEQLGVKQTVPVAAIRPLPLKISAHGDIPQTFPVAELDLLPYFKRGRRRKQHQQTVTFQDSADTNGSLTYPCRELSNRSFCGSYSYLAPSAGQGGPDITSGSLTAQPGSGNIWSNVGAVLATGSSETYSNPCADGVLPVELYINTLLEATFDPWQTACHSYPTHIGLPNQPTPSAKTHYTMSGGSVPSQATGYWVPVLAVPCASNVRPMNVGWNPLQEPHLPAGVDTVRYLFNLGVEYYRMSSCGQAVGFMQAGADMDQPLGVMLDSSAGHCPGMAPPVRSKEAHSDGAAPPTGNACVKLISKTAAINLSFNLSEEYAQTIDDARLLVQGHTVTVDSACTTFDCGTVTKCLDDSQHELRGTDRHSHEHMIDDKNFTHDKHIRDDDDDVSEGMDEKSDGDSGCPSECADLSLIVGPGSSEISQCEGADFSQQLDCVNNTRARGKRRYYMYGNHKLVKPIKEIPLRFQMLLAETNAAKARCEGQPIYIQQQQPIYDCVYYPTKEGTQPQLNANATCFVPSQDSCLDANLSHTYMPDCYTLSQVPCYANTLPPGQPSHVTCLQPATMFTPPPSLPAQTTTTQSCQAIIVYSSNSTSSTHSSPQASHQMHSVSMPPPPQYPPPLTLPPPPVGQTSAHSTPCLSPAVSHVSRTVPAHYTQSAVPYSDNFLKTPGTQSQTVATSKPSVVLSVPPPNHSSAVQHNTAAAHHSVAPSNAHRLPTNSHTYLPLVPAAFPPPSNMHAASGISAQAAPSALQSPPNSACIVGSSQPVPYHGGISGNQYMYVYQSAPTGPPATSPHVVYMLGPAFPPTQNYQHPAVLFPPTCPVPVQ